METNRGKKEVIAILGPRHIVGQ